MFLTKKDNAVIFHDNGKSEIFTYGGRMPSGVLLPYVRGSWYASTYILRNAEKRTLRYVKGYVKNSAFIVTEYRDYHY